MNCSRARRQLGVSLDGELPVREAQELEAHLIQCAKCASEAAALADLNRRMDLAIDTVHIPAYPASLTGVLHRVGARPQRVILRLGLVGGPVMCIVACASVLLHLTSRHGSMRETPNTEKALTTGPTLAKLHSGTPATQRTALDQQPHRLFGQTMPKPPRARGGHERRAVRPSGSGPDASEVRSPLTNQRSVVRTSPRHPPAIATTSKQPSHSTTNVDTRDSIAATAAQNVVARTLAWLPLELATAESNGEYRAHARVELAWPAEINTSRMTRDETRGEGGEVIQHPVRFVHLPLMDIQAGAPRILTVTATNGSIYVERRYEVIGGTALLMSSMLVSRDTSGPRE